MKKSYVYMVRFDWSVEDAEDIEITLFKRYDAAYAFYKKLISDEMNPDLSWVGEQAFNDDYSVKEGFELDCSDNGDLFWHVTDLENSFRYSRIDLIKTEVK